jgi:hypothetical protein
MHRPARAVSGQPRERHSARRGGSGLLEPVPMVSDMRVP